MTANLATILKPSIEKMRKAVDDSGIFTPEICKAYDEAFDERTKFVEPKIRPECIALQIIAWCEYKRKNAHTLRDYREILAAEIFQQSIEALE